MQMFIVHVRIHETAQSKQHWCNFPNARDAVDHVCETHDYRRSDVYSVTTPVDRSEWA